MPTLVADLPEGYTRGRAIPGAVQPDRPEPEVQAASLEPFIERQSMEHALDALRFEREWAAHKAKQAKEGPGLRITEAELTEYMAQLSLDDFPQRPAEEMRGQDIIEGFLDELPDVELPPHLRPQAKEEEEAIVGSSLTQLLEALMEPSESEQQSAEPAPVRLSEVAEHEEEESVPLAQQYVRVEDVIAETEPSQMQ